MGGKLVTLIALCWNAERFIGRFLDSVLAQTYKDIQFILVNDGSNDRTDEIIQTYAEKLKGTLREFKYIVKENGGPGSAVNAALKITEGEYLSWADVDDVLHPDNIKEKAEFLDAHEECGLCICNAELIDFETGKKIRDMKAIRTETRNIFRTILFGEDGNIPCFPGVFMVRTELLMRRLNGGNIYHLPNIGQNYQLLLPVAWDNKCGFIGKCLYSYYARSESLSHSLGYSGQLDWSIRGESIVTNTMHFLDSADKDKLFADVRRKYAVKRFEMALNMTCAYYREMKECGGGSWKTPFMAATMILYTALKTAVKSALKIGGKRKA